MRLHIAPAAAVATSREQLVADLHVHDTIDKSGERVQRMFGEIAPHYDRMNHLLSLNIDRYWRWWTVKKLAAGSPASRFSTSARARATWRLPFTGRPAASRKSSPPTSAARCWRSAAASKPGRRSAPSSRSSKPTRRTCRLRTIASRSCRVAFGLRNVADTDRGLAEMTRVCRPGGQVAVLEFSTPRWQPLRGIYLLYFRHILPRIGQFFARNKSDAYEYLPASVAQFPDGEALAERMRASA